MEYYLKKDFVPRDIRWNEKPKSIYYLYENEKLISTTVFDKTGGIIDCGNNEYKILTHYNRPGFDSLYVNDGPGTIAKVRYTDGIFMKNPITYLERKISFKNTTSFKDSFKDKMLNYELKDEKDIIIYELQKGDYLFNSQFNENQRDLEGKIITNTDDILLIVLGLLRIEISLTSN